MNKTSKVSALIFLAAGLTNAADVTLSNTWTFFNPEGQSHLDNQSAAGFDFYFKDYASSAQADAVPVTSITADTITPSSGILVMAPGHGVAVSTTVVMLINQTSVAAYNTWPSAAYNATAVDANTLVIPDLPYVGNATGGTIGTSSGAVPSGGTVFPRIYQTFTPVDMSAIGAAFCVQFDLTLLGWSQTDNQNALRFVIGDTVVNSELMGMVSLGQNPTRVNYLNFRVDGTAFASPPFNTSNPYEGSLGISGQTWTAKGEFPQPHGADRSQNHLRQPGTTNRFTLNVVRVSATELSVLLRAQIISPTDNNSWLGDGSEVYVLRYDETTGYTEGVANPASSGSQSDAWGAGTLTRANTDATPRPAGSLHQFNFFCLMCSVGNLFSASTTNPDGNPDGAGITVRNLHVSTTNAFPLYTKPIAVTRDPSSGNVTIRWNSFQDSTANGSKYNVTGASRADLVGGTVIKSGIAADSSGITTSVVETGTTAPARFYRIGLDPHP